MARPQPHGLVQVLVHVLGGGVPRTEELGVDVVHYIGPIRGEY